MLCILAVPGASFSPSFFALPSVPFTRSSASSFPLPLLNPELSSLCLKTARVPIRSRDRLTPDPHHCKPHREFCFEALRFFSAPQASRAGGGRETTPQRGRYLVRYCAKAGGRGHKCPSLAAQRRLRQRGRGDQAPENAHLPSASSGNCLRKSSGFIEMCAFAWRPLL